ncbi:MAG: hypothetical protein ACRDYZ_08465, partial [Acidimicrobiales bacterium]
DWGPAPEDRGSPPPDDDPPSPGTGTGRTGNSRQRAGPRQSASRPGLEALRLAVHRPELVADRLEAMLFGDDLQRRTFEVLAAAEDLPAAVAVAEPDVADLLRRLVVEEPVAPDDPLADAAAPVVAQLIREATRRALADLQSGLRASPTELASVAPETAQARRWLEDLDDPERGRTAIDRLLAWLARPREDR